MRIAMILLAALVLGGCVGGGVLADLGWTWTATVLICVGAAFFVYGTPFTRSFPNWAVILFLAFVLVACSSAQAAEIDLPLLRDTICDHETRGVKDRDLGEPGPFGEIGRCQIRVSTARQLGMTSHWSWLLIPAFNEDMALRKLNHCNRRTVFALAFCFNAGKQARIDKDHRAWGYAYQVRQNYYRALLAKQLSGR